MSIWEERWHPLREEWVIIAAHRQDRPWSGETIAQDEETAPDYVPDCYLCPGNLRVSGRRNDDYKSVFVFDNDHPCVGPKAPVDLETPAGIYKNRPASGIARVVCYSPKHNETLAELPSPQIAELLTTWQAQYLDLGARPGIDNVLFFENKGAIVGVSNPHPHCQIYATNFVFPAFETEARAAERHYADTGKILFEDIIASEKQDGRRILAENDTAIGILPYFARYAYEVHIAPKQRHPSLATMSAKEIDDLAAALRTVLVKLDNLWRMSFPYVMILHQAPTDGKSYDSFHFHIELLPPLRKPNLRKFLGGPEIGGGGFLSDTSPEEKAAELIAQPDIHYRHR